MSDMKARMESAQHILHHILINDYCAKQTGMQIYDNKIKIDIKCKANLIQISKEELEERINKIIKNNLPVIITIYSRDKIPKYIDISSIPAYVKDIKIVAIGDYDIQPCGNKHVRNTSKIGDYKIISIRKNGKDVYSIEGTVINST